MSLAYGAEMASFDSSTTAMSARKTMSIKFGAVSQRDDYTQIQETLVVKRSAADGFAWAMLFPEGLNPKVCKEVLELPVAPKAQSIQTADIVYREGGRIAIRESAVANGDVGLLKMWGLDPADPVGKYKLSIYIDAKLIKEINFSVVD
jgi:hypothetical protein